MYILYADESGTAKDASQQYFVLAGFCVFERQCYWLGEELEKIAARFDAADPIIKPHFDAEGGIIHGLHESQ